MSACEPSVNQSCALQSLTEQELHLKTQIKQLEANVISAAPDKAKQKQMEKSLDGYRKGAFLTPSCFLFVVVRGSSAETLL